MSVMRGRRSKDAADCDEAGKQLRVLLAMVATRRRDPGPCPPLEDLVAWHEGCLAEDDAHRVLSHVAHCEDCHRQWMDIYQEMEEEAAETLVQDGRIRATVGSLARWWRLRKAGWRLGLAGVLAAATASLLLLVYGPPGSGRPDLNELIGSGYRVFVNSYSPGQLPERWPWTESPDYRPKDISALLQGPTALERAAFQAGVRAGLQEAGLRGGYWRRIAATLGEFPGSCPGGGSGRTCRRRRQLLFLCGRWAVLVHLRCRLSGGEAFSADWRKLDRRILKRLETQAENLELSPAVKFLLKRWSRKTGEGARNQAAHCDGARSLLDKMLLQGP